MGYQGWATAVGIKHRIPARLNEPLGRCLLVAASSPMRQ